MFSPWLTCRHKRLVASLSPWLRREFASLSPLLRRLVAVLSPWLRRLVARLSPWLRQLIARLSFWQIRFCSQAVWHVVDKVTLWKVFLCHYHFINAACCSLICLSQLAEGPKSSTGIRKKWRKFQLQMWQYWEGWYLHLPVQGHTWLLFARTYQSAAQTVINENH
jgi:hypothetical protein